MPWNPVTWLQATDTAIAATEADGNWVFRGQPDVFGWREELGKLSYKSSYVTYTQSRFQARYGDA
jgi:hypothetical protein